MATWNNSNGRAGDRGRGPGGQAEMGEDLGDHGGIFDGGDDLQGAAAVGVCSISISNTRLSSRAQLMCAGAEGWAVLG